MCILFIYTNPSPRKNGYRLIVASNRDEYYNRPAENAFLCPETKIVGGRDMELNREGGMWLGASINKTKDYSLRFGCLLNVTGEQHRTEAKGRGFIVVEYIKNQIGADKYISQLAESAPEHNAFNFVAVELSKDGSKVHFLSNSPCSQEVFEGNQILGFGNSPLKSPLMKVQRGTEKFSKIVDSLGHTEHKENLIESLLGLLKWEEKHLPDGELKRRAPSGYEFLCSVYVKVLAAGYGTRTHSVILVDHDWNFEFIESTMEQPIDSSNPTWNTGRIKANL